jgi:hypothetical protein
MKKRILLAIVVLTGIFLLSASIVWAAPAPVEKTGQTTSYRTGDDGDHEKGVNINNEAGPRFTDNGDWTVTDNLTGLMWAKDALLPNTYITDWNDAIDFSNNLSLGTSCGTPLTDWRLPNVKELQSLIDFGNQSPALPTGHPFTSVQSSDYWSSTTSASNTDGAFGVYIVWGMTGYKTKASSDGYVWPVRGGN